MGTQRAGLSIVRRPMEIVHQKKSEIISETAAGAVHIFLFLRRGLSISLHYQKATSQRRGLLNLGLHPQRSHHKVETHIKIY